MGVLALTLLAALAPCAAAVAAASMIAGVVVVKVREKEGYNGMRKSKTEIVWFLFVVL